VVSPVGILQEDLSRLQDLLPKLFQMSDNKMKVLQTTEKINEVSLITHVFVVVRLSRADNVKDKGKSAWPSGTFRVTLYGRRSAAHRAFATKKHQLRPRRAYHYDPITTRDTLLIFRVWA
jgi:hypothetical protein